MRRFLLTFICLTSFIACASTPPPNPNESNSSIAAITVAIEDPLLSFISRPPVKVYFTRVNDDGSFSGDLIEANYISSNTAYLMNVEPGKYAGVLAVMKGKSSGGAIGSIGSATLSVSATPHYFAFFPKDLVEKTTVEVRPGIVSFMGSCKISNPGFSGMKNADETQKKYFSAKFPGAEIGSTKNLPIGSNPTAGSIKAYTNSQEAKAKFLKSASKHLKNSEWIKIL